MSEPETASPEAPLDYTGSQLRVLTLLSVCGSALMWAAMAVCAWLILGGIASMVSLPSDYHTGDYVGPEVISAIGGIYGAVGGAVAGGLLVGSAVLGFFCTQRISKRGFPVEAWWLSQVQRKVHALGVVLVGLMLGTSLIGGVVLGRFIYPEL